MPPTARLAANATMAAPFKVKALFEYSSPHEDDLQFPAGQVITVTEEEDDDWYTGEYVDDAGAKHEGIFPRNFVEKYEPVAPPRPTRTRTKKESDPVAPPPPLPPVELPAGDPAPSSKPLDEEEEPEPAAASAAPAPPVLPTTPLPEAAPAPAPPVPPVSSTPPPLPKAAEPQATSPPISAKPSKPGAPPPPAAKPTGNAFKDRIAAFNKATAPPVTPFKPSGLSGSAGFIKKPFVAPPPSRNAYVPPPREAPTAKVYRRDEDPEIKEREQENLQSAEKAGLVAGSSQSAEGDDEPKPLSLKERMALLQRQQQEQAQRHADAAAKKEKLKRPAKKRVESNDGADEGESSQSALPPLERQDSGETAGRPSVDEPPVGRANRRKSSTRGLGEPNDGNEADLSGAGDTTEGQEDLTEREDSDDKPALPVRAAGPATEAPGVEGAEEEEEEEDEDVDPEVRRKEELRARMAKMSGGMGMAGMFGMPMPSPSAPAKKKKAPPASVERRSSEAPEAAPSPPFQPPPVPAMMMALPGLSAKRPEESAPIPEEQAEAPVAENNDDEDGSTPMQAATPAIGSKTPYQTFASAGVVEILTYLIPFIVLARVPTGGAPPVPSGRPAPPPVLSEGISLGLCGSSTYPGRSFRGED